MGRIEIEDKIEDWLAHSTISRLIRNLEMTESLQEALILEGLGRMKVRYMGETWYFKQWQTMRNWMR